jgi:clan AA aspartic protease
MAKETGRVQVSGEACVFVEVIEGEKIEFIIDTGFNGFLTMPAILMSKLDFEIVGEEEVSGVGQYKIVFPIAVTKIFWLGEKREVQVLINDGEDVLLGTEMLQDCVLRINYRNKRVLISN